MLLFILIKSNDATVKASIAVKTNIKKQLLYKLTVLKKTSKLSKSTNIMIQIISE